mmetsp:Transcript_119754/g.298737  ORF Transcript_119754/g.298737 Transcript_119754/m.298737 type:complete len:800 (-) Transcript_119754:221-2620(-)
MVLTRSAGEGVPDACKEAEIDRFLETLRANLLAEKPTDLNDFAHSFCKRHVSVHKMSQSEQASLLCTAAARGDVKELQVLLDKGLDPDMGDYDFRTPLHLAAEEFHAPCVRLLLDAGAETNVEDRWGTTPLAGVEALLALGVEHHGPGEEVAELLLDAGGSRGKVLSLPKTISVSSEELELQRSTLCRSVSGSTSASADDFDSAVPTLFEAAAQGRVAIVSKFLKEGKYSVASVNYDGRTALHLASEKGHLPVVKLLVERQANVLSEDHWGNTPLSGAERNSHFRIADFLRDCGAKSLVRMPRTFEQNTAIARQWWEDHLISQTNAPRSADKVSSKILRDVLQNGYGFDLSRHKVLAEEVERLEALSGMDEPMILRSDFMMMVLGACLAQNKSGIGLRSNKSMVMGRVRSLREPDASPANSKARSVDGNSVLSHIVLGKLAIGSWSSFVKIVRDVFERVLADKSLSEGPDAGKNADYIPELKNAPSDRLAISICTVDGQTCSFGDADEHFSVQSTGKSFAYTLAMRQHTKAHNPNHEGPEGAAFVHMFVGREPSGRAFNDFTLTRPDARGIAHPFNPVTNAGAIVTCSMIDENNGLPVFPGVSQSARMESRLEKYKDFLSDLCGGETVGDCMDVFESERAEAYNNYALANFMMARGTFPPTVKNHDDLNEAVDFYLRVCSARVNARMLAAAAASYATFGTCPLTGTTAMTMTEAKQTLAILSSCGMYDFSGEWACTVGLPAKSGVSGNIMIVVPGMLGMCIWSPRLDELGNSVRGIRIAQLLKEHLSCSLLDLIARHRA